MKATTPNSTILIDQCHLEISDQQPLTQKLNHLIHTTNRDLDKKLLFEILKETQCPLMPQKMNTNELKSFYYFNNEFWIKDEDGNGTSCKMIEFKSDDFKNKCKDDAELMFCVDEYVKSMRINKSFEIHEKLEVALAEANGEDDGDDSNDANKLLIPTNIGRLLFIGIFFMTSFNAYFLAISIEAATNKVYDSPFLNATALMMAICEAVLYANIFFGKILFAIISLCIALLTKNTTYIHTKTIAIQLRELSVLSILRYMPSIEILSSKIIHWKQSIAKIWTDFYLLFSSLGTSSSNNNMCHRIFAFPSLVFLCVCIHQRKFKLFSVYFVELVCPILSLMAILVKVKQLEFVFDGEPFNDWHFRQYVVFIAFINQVAGLRVLRNVEAASIQHFVFSGSDASLDKDELILLDKWWNVTILSAVSNLNLGWYDNMVFWYSLDPQKIQLLLKHHDTRQLGKKSLIEMVQNDDFFLESYDKIVMEKLMKRMKSS